MVYYTIFGHHMGLIGDSAEIMRKLTGFIFSDISAGIGFYISAFSLVDKFYFPSSVIFLILFFYGGSRVFALHTCRL